MMNQMNKVAPPPKITGIDDVTALAKAFNNEGFLPQLDALRGYLTQCEAAYKLVGEAKAIATLRKQAGDSRAEAITAVGEAHEEAGRIIDAGKAADLGRKIYKLGYASWGLMNEFSWTILTAPGIKQRDLDLAMKAAQAAYDGCRGKDASVVKVANSSFRRWLTPFPGRLNHIPNF